MTIDRTTIISGPALVQYDGQTFYSKGDITLKTIVNRFQVTSSHVGIIDERATDKRIEVVFEPAGQFTDTLAAVLWPYASTLPGSSVFGSTDKSLVIWGRDGQKHTVKNARVTTMPNIQFGTTKTTIGSITFTGLVANSADPSLLASYYTVAAATYPGDTTFDPGEIWTLGPEVALGLTTGIKTEDGVDVSFSVAMREEMVDGIGTVDMKVGNVEATATFIPVTTQGLGELVGGIGAESSTLALAVTCGTGAPALEFGGSVVTESEYGWGDRKRSGAMSVKAIRLFAAGAAAALFSVASATEVIAVSGTLTSDGSTPVVFPTLYKAPDYSGKEAFSEDGDDVSSSPEWSIYWDGSEWLMFTAGYSASWSNASTSSTVPLTGWVAVSPATGTPGLTRKLGVLPA